MTSSGEPGQKNEGTSPFAGPDALAAPPFILPALAYHHVHPDIGGPWSVPPDVFARHLDWIAEHGGTVSLDAAVAAFDRGEESPAGVVITFDDGFASFAEYAAPLLAERGLTAVNFLITEYIGGWDEWATHARHRSDHLQWDQIRSLRDRGFEFGSHSEHHHALVKFERERIKRELHGSADTLERELSQPARYLAYPYGSFDDIVLEVAEKRYRFGFASGMKGVVNWRESPLEIHRVVVMADWPMEELARRVELYGTPGG